MKLNDRTYSIMKWLVIIVLPACGALWAGLSQIWTLPYASEIPATITVLCTFLGAVLCISTAEYYRTEADAEGKHENSTPPIFEGIRPDPDAYEAAKAETGGTATLDEIIADLKDTE